MTYTPKTWECGETITAEDLNHMEQGIADGQTAVSSLPQRIVSVTAEDLIACADGDNVVNEFDILEHAIKRHIGVIPKGDGNYFVAYDFSFNSSWNMISKYSFPLSIVYVYFMGADTSANMGLNLIFTFDGVVENVSKASALPQNPPTATIGGVTYSIIPLNGTKRQFNFMNQ